MEEGIFAGRTVSLTGAAVFGSLAALSTLIFPARIQPSSAILRFLRFNPAELFSVLAFLMFGPIPAVRVSWEVHLLRFFSGEHPVLSRN